MTKLLKNNKYHIVAERDNFSGELALRLENFTTLFLSEGRADWDVPHTKAVVYHAGQIAKKENLDELVLITTAWLHDIGYYGQFENLDSSLYEDIQDRKVRHMLLGPLYSKEFLNRPEISKFYTQEQKNRIIHLISVHDKIEELKDLDELAFMEADTLGAIDVSRVKSTFTKQDAEKYIIKDLLGRRRPKFKTPTGIDTFDNILPAYLKQYDLESTFFD